MSDAVACSCLCGAVTFSLMPPLRPVIACHCGTCRKSSGHFWAATAVARDRLIVTNDAGLSWYDSSDTARRGFCDQCGSSLFYDPHGEDRIAVSAGAIDGTTGLALQSHVFIAEKGDYYDPGGDVPCHDHFSGREQDA